MVAKILLLALLLGIRISQLRNGMKLYKTYNVQRRKAINHLLASEYLQYAIESGTKTYYVCLTRKGIDAINGEWFYMKTKN